MLHWSSGGGKMTKRKIVLFFVVLAIMLLVKYASGQDAGQEAVGWDPQPELFGSVESYIGATMFYGVLFGVVSGLCRVLDRHSAAKRGLYFTGDLVSLQL